MTRIRHIVGCMTGTSIDAIDVESMKESFRIKGCSAPHVVKYGPLKKHAFVTCKKVTGVAIIDPATKKLV